MDRLGLVHRGEDAAGGAGDRGAGDKKAEAAQQRRALRAHFTPAARSAKGMNTSMA